MRFVVEVLVAVNAITAFVGFLVKKRRADTRRFKANEEEENNLEHMRRLDRETQEMDQILERMGTYDQQPRRQRRRVRNRGTDA